MASTTSGADTAPTTTRRRAAKQSSSSEGAKSESAPADGYRHAAAVHRDSQPSWLSADAPSTPSFIGFRNLMAISLSTAPSSSHAPGEVDPC